VRFPAFCSTDGRWRIDERALQRAFTSRTRLVILVSPNNPTGAYLASEQLAAIQHLCDAKRVPLVLDEVFHDYPAEGCCAPEATDEETQGLTLRLSGLSKVIGAPQVKLGWVRLSGAEPLVRAATSRLEFVADTYLSASTPAQLVAQVLLPVRAPLQARIRERLGENQRAAGQAFSAGSPARLLPREGGWYGVLRLPEGEDDEDLAYQLLVDDRVIVQPGFFFDFPQGEHLVLSLLSPVAEFSEGVQRLAARIAARAS
jgi:alanine-synthesizing transaminase